MSFLKAFIFSFSLGILFFACKKITPPETTGNNLMAVPPGFPAMQFPADNEFTLARWRLGKKLFYDRALSVSNSISCASCHKPELAFSDDIAFSVGEQNQVGNSNAPSLSNIGYHPYFTRAGGVPTLEMQILVPIQEHNEFNFNIVDLSARLNAMPTYREEALAAYGREVDPFVITRAIATFERSLISSRSAYDRYRYKNQKQAMNPSEIRGMNLFFSERSQCAQCHQGFNFSTYAFENNGLYLTYKDSGRMRLTHQEADRALFKVPTLRNIGFTAPYMHDGSLQTLEAVIEHYNSGGQAHPHKSALIKPLHLSDEEKKDLLHFLNALNDYQFIQQPLFRNEHAN